MAFAAVLYRADGREGQYKLANRDRQIGLIVDERFVAGLRGGCAHDRDLEIRLVDTVKHRHNSGTGTPSSRGRADTKGAVTVDFSGAKWTKGTRFVIVEDKVFGGRF
ncbi:hypothetical protein CH63R_06632 [Colletotrichum higginsianum IMI 349063]|uniref:Uncharacterized protein n=1 Tax=Colletotrichum higginsianum (strain IMI 349063) TaxID=759273 RepID=A0A1B7YG65_COLHI|nr:hypothetical protein CH63R_06632 [Colletotrichum higginsianum IMI 349063]OBR10940.1 hypothetical protein CH63R_06632 [Colletotrichum higginsianum IMI 349063]